MKRLSFVEKEHRRWELNFEGREKRMKKL